MSEQASLRGHVGLQTRLDRSLLPEKGGSCIVWITITAQAISHGPRARLNLALVLDRSGSMSGHKLEYVKQAAQHVLRLLDQRDRVAVIIYDDEVQVLASSQAVDDSARASLIKLIDPIRTGGSTNLGGGWLEGCDQVAAFLDPEATNRTLLLTDGLANVGITDREELAKHAKQLRQRGVSTTTLGVGADFDEHMLKAISDAGGGHFYFITQPGDIPGYFESELGEMLTMVARNLVLTMEIPIGTKVDVLNDYESSLHNGVLSLPLGEIASHQSVDLVLRFEMPAAGLGSTLPLRTSLNYQCINTQPSVVVSNDSIVTIVSQQQYEQQAVNYEVADLAVKLELARAQNKAMRLSHDGLDGEAARVLRQSSQLVDDLYGTAPSAPMARVELEEFEVKLSHKSLSPSVLKQTLDANYRRQHSRPNLKKEENQS